MNSSIFNFDVIRAYFRLPLNRKIEHVVLAGLGGIILLLWLHFSPLLVPNNRTMAVRALSSSTRVLISGTSRVERGVDPRLFSMDIVNLSSGGLSYLTMGPVIKRAIERAPNVELVVIELDIFLLKSDGLIKNRLFELGIPIKDWPVSKVDRYGYMLNHGGALSAMQRVDVEYYAQSIKDNERPPQNSKGYNPFIYPRNLVSEENNRLYGAEWYLTHHRIWLANSLEQPNTSALLDLLRWLDERKIKWALVTLPHLPDWIRDRPGEWVATVASTLQAVHDQFPGEAIRYWDSSSSLGLDRADFHDGVHLNRRGVEIFNHEFNTRITTWIHD